MMSRVQISLHPEDYRRAAFRAAELGVSFAEYVRRLVRRDLGESPPPADTSALFDLGEAGGSDVASRKDAYLGDAFEATG